MTLANIEGDEIVIRIPISAVPYAASVAFEATCGEHGPTVVDAVLFAAEITHELNQETETGTTPVHLMLDAACNKAADNGGSGLSTPPSKPIPMNPKLSDRLDSIKGETTRVSDERLAEFLDICTRPRWNNESIADLYARQLHSSVAASQFYTACLDLRDARALEAANAEMVEALRPFAVLWTEREPWGKRAAYVVVFGSRCNRERNEIFSDLRGSDLARAARALAGTSDAG